MTSPSRKQPEFDPSVDGGASAAGASGKYACTVKELKELMTLRGHEGYQKIQDDYRPGGVFEICRRLRSSAVNGEFKVTTALRIAQGSRWCAAGKSVAVLSAYFNSS